LYSVVFLLLNLYDIFFILHFVVGNSKITYSVLFLHVGCLFRLFLAVSMVCGSNLHFTKKLCIEGITSQCQYKLIS